MTKKQNTIYGVIGLLIGVVGGIAGTAFSMGADRQKLQDSIIHTGARITAMEDKQYAHEAQVEKEMNRYAEIIAAHITQLQESIGRLNSTVGDLRTDVQVLKALMERMEEDIKAGANPINR